VYVGPNPLLQAAIGRDSGATLRQTQRIGVKRLYHATSTAAAQEIRETGKMVPGACGMFGGAIYFADSIEAALHKARFKEWIVEANVDMGKALIVEAPDRNLDLVAVREVGCDSVKGRSSPGAAWEYVVFESDRVAPRSAFAADDRQAIEAANDRAARPTTRT
jgi:hypothetical protein